MGFVDSGYGYMEDLQNLQKLRERVWKCYNNCRVFRFEVLGIAAYRSFASGYECRTELT